MIWLMGNNDQINTAKAENNLHEDTIETVFKDEVFMTAAAMKMCLDECL